MFSDMLQLYLAYCKIENWRVYKVSVGLQA